MAVLVLKYATGKLVGGVREGTAQSRFHRQMNKDQQSTWRVDGAHHVMETDVTCETASTLAYHISQTQILVIHGGIKRKLSKIVLLSMF